MEFKHICFVLDGYPYQEDNSCVFVRNLIHEIADLGFQCSVIAPRIITKANIKKKIPYHRTDITSEGNRIDVYTPYYLHLSSNKVLMGLSMHNHYHAVLKTVLKEKLNINYIYGHFIYQNGLTAAKIAEKFGIPSFCAVGENSTRISDGNEPYSTGLKYHNWSKIISKLTGIISVSNYNLELLRQNGYIDSKTNTIVCPNGINKNVFHPCNTEEVRKKLHLPAKKFIVSFTGAFSKRKGIGVLCDALNQCENVYSIFMGKGDILPNCNGMLFCGSVPNEKLRDYINASDVFVLPTLGEGCCNAIIEALACGKPVVSSDLPFNDGILTEENSIRVDCTDSLAIAEAITLLKEDSVLRNRLAVGALQSTEGLDNRQRAERILGFMGALYD